DRAGDGPATCRTCHEDVDPVDFHWTDRRKPLLSAGATCTTCHTVHTGQPQPAEVEPDAVEPDTIAPVVLETNAVCMKCHEPAFARTAAGAREGVLGGAHASLHGTVHEG